MKKLVTIVFSGYIENMSYSLHQEQFIATDIATAWDFFSRPENLGKLTPPDVGFEIVHNSSEVMTEGQIITYKIRIFPLVKLSWVTEITHIETERKFIDNQRVGPYALWHHTHTFEEVDGGVLMKDDIHYALPMGILGEIAHRLFVRSKLQSIFNYRKTAVEELFQV